MSKKKKHELFCNEAVKVIAPCIDNRQDIEYQLGFLKRYYKQLDNDMTKEQYKYVRKLIKLKAVQVLDMNWETGWSAFVLTVTLKELKY